MPTPSAPLARTPLHHWHARHGARFIESDGWQLAAVYSSIDREVAAARSGLALADISAFAKTSWRGAGVPALAGALAGDSAASRPRGVATLPTNGPALACRLTGDHLLLLAPTTADRLPEVADSLATVRSDVTSAYAGFGLIGPRTEEALRHVTPLDVSQAALPAGSCAETSLAGVHALLVRPPETALPAVQIYIAWDLGEYVWERLLDAGRGFGLAPVGLEGWRALLAQ
ncbi:MAG TPA: hypothetical protein VG013_39975 [Gemmataceae bacterium]|jgi:sarcosine oxidase subunit alpha|nr:hypothetical protein [Gemmataceae bacterium]